MPKVQLTQAGYQKLVDELEDLKNNKRAAALDRLAKARAMGDLRENSEYHAAKEEQGFIEGRIRELEELIKNAEVVEAPKDKSAITLGCKVTVEANKTRVTYDIVGEYEADPMQKKLSQASPIGKALIGKKKGDEVEIAVPAGMMKYTVVEVEHN